VTELLNKLRLVRGAVSSKDFVPALTHFRISNGKLIGANGHVKIETQVEELSMLDIVVPADKFLRAFDMMGDPKITVSEGSITLSKGRTRAKLPLLTEYPTSIEAPDHGTGVTYETSSLLSTLKLLRPFVSDDASRHWAMSIHFIAGRAFATNNIVLAAIGYGDPHFSLDIPSFAVDEIIRINKEVNTVTVYERAAVFTFVDSDVVLTSQLFNETWPDVAKMLDEQDWQSCKAVEGLDVAEQIAKIVPFSDGVQSGTVSFLNGTVKTADGDMQAEIELEAEWATNPSRWNFKPLERVLAASTHIELNTYPAPCPFKNEETGVMGIVVGVK
jgi:DNA polymerase III sliding clamp (beta) subunit (PCNA family)